MRFIQLVVLIFGIYLVWTIIKPYLIKVQRKTEIKGKRTSEKFHIDKENIQDAEFKDIDNADKQNS